MTIPGRHRKVCDRNECRAQALAAAGRIGGQRKRARAPGTHTCPHCARTLPRNGRHFYAARRDKETGEVTRWDCVCKRCQKAIQREKYHSMPGRRARHLAAARRQRERIEARRREDPAFDAEFRRKRKEWNRRARSGGSRKPDRVPDRASPRLPGRPLAEAITRLIERDRPEEAELSTRTIEAVCERLGVSSKSYSRWLDGGQVQLDVADTALARGGLLWFDVWDPAEHPEVARCLGDG